MLSEPQTEFHLPKNGDDFVVSDRLPKLPVHDIVTFVRSSVRPENSDF